VIEQLPLFNCLNYLEYVEVIEQLPLFNWRGCVAALSSIEVALQVPQFFHDVESFF
jgi:hypothetical protein